MIDRLIVCLFLRRLGIRRILTVADLDEHDLAIPPHLGVEQVGGRRRRRRRRRKFDAFSIRFVWSRTEAALNWACVALRCVALRFRFVFFSFLFFSLSLSLDSEKGGEFESPELGCLNWGGVGWISTHLNWVLSPPTDLDWIGHFLLLLLLSLVSTGAWVRFFSIGHVLVPVFPFAFV